MDVWFLIIAGLVLLALSILSFWMWLKTIIKVPDAIPALPDEQEIAADDQEPSDNPTISEAEIMSEDETVQNPIPAQEEQGTVKLTAVPVSRIPIPDHFDPSRIQDDLESIAGKPNMVAQYLEGLRKTYTKRKQIKLIESYTEFYEKSTRGMNEQKALKRAQLEYQRLELEDETERAKLESDKAQYELHTAEARQKIADLRKPKEEPKVESKLTAEQERILIRHNLEKEIARLIKNKAREMEACSDEEDRKGIENMYDDRIRELREKRKKYL